MNSPYLTVREAAEYRRSSVRDIQRRVGNGEFQRYYSGTRVLLLRAEVEASVQPAKEAKRRPGRPITRREPVVIVS